MQKRNGGIRLARTYIRAVTPQPDHILRVEFFTGSVLLLDLSRRLDSLRLRPLRDPAVWAGAVTSRSRGVMKAPTFVTRESPGVVH